MAKSDYLEAKTLDHNLGVSAYTMPTTHHLALYTTATDDSGGGTEVTGGSYARQPISFNAATGTAPTQSTNNGLVTFPVATASWGTITHWRVFDAIAGNALYHGALDASKTIDTDDQFTVPDTNLKVQEA